MRRQWTMLSLILLGMLLILRLNSLAHREPMYGGKTVTQWLDAGYEDCATALHEIGPEALPFVLASFGRTEQPLQAIPQHWKHIFSDFMSVLHKTPACNLDENRVCSLTLELGPRTIPILARELGNRHRNIRVASARALNLWHKQGKDIRVAVPYLTTALNDPEPAVRMWAARALGSDARLADEGVNTLASHE